MHRNPEEAVHVVDLVPSRTPCWTCLWPDLNRNNMANRTDLHVRPPFLDRPERPEDTLRSKTYCRVRSTPVEDFSEQDMFEEQRTNPRVVRWGVFESFLSTFIPL